MISKINTHKGTKFLGDYLEEKREGHALFLGGNFFTDNNTFREHVELIKEHTEQRPGLKKNVFHGIISLPNEEQLSENDWRSVADQYMNFMGFSECPFLMVLHTDTPHHHIHIMGSRVDCNGKTISDSNSYARSHAVMRILEKKYGLRKVEMPKYYLDKSHKDPSGGEAILKTRLEGRNEKLTKDKIKEIFQGSVEVIRQDSRLDINQKFRAFVNLAKARGVTVHSYGDSKKIKGMKFEMEGRFFKASNLGKKFGVLQLEKEFGGVITQSPDFYKKELADDYVRFSQENEIRQEDIETNIEITTSDGQKIDLMKAIVDYAKREAVRYGKEGFPEEMSLLKDLSEGMELRLEIIENPMEEIFDADLEYENLNLEVKNIPKREGIKGISKRIKKGDKGHKIRKNEKVEVSEPPKISQHQESNLVKKPNPVQLEPKRLEQVPISKELILRFDQLLEFELNRKFGNKGLDLQQRFERLRDGLKRRGVQTKLIKSNAGEIIDWELKLGDHWIRGSKLGEKYSISSIAASLKSEMQNQTTKKGIRKGLRP